MNSRDKVHSSEYFSNYLNRIIPFEERTYNGFVQAEQEKNNIGISRWGRAMSEGIITKISIWYSMGKPITKEWQDFYENNIKYYIYSISPELLNGGYKNSLQILSLGILLNIESDVFKKISERVLEENYRDFILDRLIQSKYYSHPVSPDLQFPNEGYIKDMAYILRSGSKLEAIQIASDSLQNDFHTKENLANQYASHKTNHYIGYWAWEMGALVKILRLDDSILKDEQYYPCDLVHWTEN